MDKLITYIFIITVYIYYKWFLFINKSKYVIVYKLYPKSKINSWNSFLLSNILNIYFPKLSVIPFILLFLINIIL